MGGKWGKTCPKTEFPTMSKSPLTNLDCKRGYRTEDKAAALAAQAAGKPYKLSDMERMYLLISKAGTRSWYWNFRFSDPTTGEVEDCTLALGKWPELGVTEAREKRREAEKMVEKGIHPTRFKKQQVQLVKEQQLNTFWSICLEWMENNSPDPHNPNPKQPGKWSASYARQVRSFMTRYVGNAPIGHRPISEVTSGDIFRLVQGVGIRKAGTTGKERKATGAPTVGILVKQWCGAVFALAIATERYEKNNPALGFDISLAFKKPKTKNNRPLTDAELTSLLEKLAIYHKRVPDRSWYGQRQTAIAIELLLLTFTRTIELRAARWEEFDLEKGVWMVPALRMKMGLPHIVPLSTQAIALLNELRIINAPNKHGEGWLFRNARNPDRCMGATAINKALVAMGFVDDLHFRAHGARGTASTHLNENGYDERFIERQLAHSSRNKVAAAYNAAKWLNQRRQMMQDYGNYLDKLKGITPVESSDHSKAA
jgi:integrase